MSHDVGDQPQADVALFNAVRAKLNKSTEAFQTAALERFVANWGSHRSRRLRRGPDGKLVGTYSGFWANFLADDSCFAGRERPAGDAVIPRQQLRALR